MGQPLRSGQFFSNKKSKRKRLIFIVINLLETLTFLCSLILFLIGLNQLQTTKHVIMIDFSSHLQTLLSLYGSNSVFVAGFGLGLSLITSMINGIKQLNFVTFLYHLFWSTVMFTQFNIASQLIGESDLLTLKPFLCLVLISLCCLKAIFFNIRERREKNYFEKLREEKLKKLENQISNEIQFKSGKNADEDNSIKNIDSDDARLYQRKSESIDEQIKSLCILDELQDDDFQDVDRESNLTSSSSSQDSLNSNSVYKNEKSIVLPAKFKHESFAQSSSWHSNSNPSNSYHPKSYSRTYNGHFIDNSSSFQGYSNCSTWLFQHNNGLITPPSSVHGSVNGMVFLVIDFLKNLHVFY